MPVLVGYILLFITVGAGFIFVHLLAGKFIRPANPNAEKLTIYECGEPTIGSAWVQFDLRFYVVALLFVIFDVEVAFFFPWAVVFGKTNELARENISIERRAELAKDLTNDKDPLAGLLKQRSDRDQEKANLLAASRPESAARIGKIDEDVAGINKTLITSAASNRKAANQFGWIAFVDILIFFGVLLVGFAYLWKRGDLEWVRSTASERASAPGKAPAPGRREPLVVVASSPH